MPSAIDLSTGAALVAVKHSAAAIMAQVMDFICRDTEKNVHYSSQPSLYTTLSSQLYKHRFGSVTLRKKLRFKSIGYLALNKQKVSFNNIYIQIDDEGVAYVGVIVLLVVDHDVGLFTRHRHHNVYKNKPTPFSQRSALPQSALLTLSSL